ncbi:VWA domain-containing protein, partial [Ruminococcaceae bacterium OttesenSCG-928-O06]|nr:VWA domain-containing protein [Ruminococcaceae bacterium OttesenSCG-928-O06]
MSSKLRIGKKAAALALTLMIMLTLVPVSVFAAPGSSIPYDPSDTENFPVWPAAGGVNLDKSAVWVDEDTTIAEIELVLKGQPIPQAVDFLVIQDTSGSMGFGSGSGYSPCTNPAHLHTVTFTKDVTYYEGIPTGNWWNPYSWQEASVSGHQTLTVELVYHDNTLRSYTVLGYNPDAGRFSTAITGGNYWEASQWSSSGNPRTFLLSTNGFRGSSGTSSKGGTATFPASLSTSESSIPGCTNRMDTAKTALKTLADKVLGPTMVEGANGTMHPIPSPHRMEIIDFASSASALLGSFTGASGLSSVHSAIEGMSDDGGTRYDRAITEAVRVAGLRNSTNPLVVIFLSDGEPDSNPNNVDSLKGLSGLAGIYTVGLGLRTTNAVAQMKNLAKEPGYFINVADNSNALLSALEDIISKSLPAATDATVTDLMGSEAGGQFTMMPLGPKDPVNGTYPITVTREGGAPVVITTAAQAAAAGITIAPDGKSFTWAVGDIPANGITLQYYAKIQDGATAGEYPANDQATVEYTNYLENEVSREFPVPTLVYPGGSILQVYYEVNAEGKPLTSDGLSVMPGELTYSNLKLTGHILQTPTNVLDPVTGPTLVPGEPYNVTVPPTIAKGDVTYAVYGTNMLAANIGVPPATYTPMPFTQVLRIQQAQDAYVALIPYTRSYTVTFTVTNGKIDDTAPGFPGGTLSNDGKTLTYVVPSGGTFPTGAPNNSSNPNKKVVADTYYAVNDDTVWKQGSTPAVFPDKVTSDLNYTFECELDTTDVLVRYYLGEVNDNNFLEELTLDTKYPDGTALEDIAVNTNAIDLFGNNWPAGYDPDGEISAAHSLVEVKLN